VRAASGTYTQSMVELWRARLMLHVIASRLEQCLSTLEVADASPFQPWLDAITVTSRDITHIVDAQVLASPAEIDANNSAGIPRIR
jgi:hypothetical protein